MMRRFGYETMRRDVLGAKGSTPQWVGDLFGMGGPMKNRYANDVVTRAVYGSIHAPGLERYLAVVPG